MNVSHSCACAVLYCLHQLLWHARLLVFAFVMSVHDVIVAFVMSVHDVDIAAVDDSFLLISACFCNRSSASGMSDLFVDLIGVHLT